MSKLLGGINKDSVPTVGTAGHVSGKNLRSKVPGEVLLKNLKNAVTSHCPVNKNIDTMMTKRAFIATCKAIKRLAEKDRGRKNKNSITTMTGFRSSNKRNCLNCERGRLIAKNKPFRPPKGVKFEELEDIEGRVSVDRKIKKRGKRKLSERKAKKRGIKLTKQDVIRIRKMYEEGYSVPGLCEIFPVTTSTMYRVVNRESWKNVSCKT